MRKPDDLKPPRANFHDWLLAQRGRPDEIGAFAARWTAGRRRWNARSLLFELLLRGAPADFRTRARAAAEYRATRMKVDVARAPARRTRVRTYDRLPPELRA